MNVYAHGILGFIAYVPNTVALAIVITWVSNHAKGSLLITMLLHTVTNIMLDALGFLPNVFVHLPTLLDFFFPLGVGTVVLVH